MPPSFGDLQARIADLQRQFLPATFSATGQYEPELQDDFRSFRLLVHAEVEACLESMAVATADACVAGWKADGVVRRVIVALLASYRSRSLIDYWDTRTTARIGRPQVMHVSAPAVAAVDAALNDYHKTVRKNHGIKRANVLTLVQPLGVKIDDMDDLWLNDLEAFGANRGTTAHNSAIAATAIDPASDLNTVRRIEVGLKALEVTLARLVRV